mmetsp:Transcript_19366/g.45329  ORF Transcript_19366/g.45329 Transcript_19366/m.45329 type:complete len:477 (+) Transcript_19366:132-1562(+)
MSLDLVLAELKAKDKSLQEFRQKHQAMLEENQRLVQTLADKEKDTFEVISYLRSENDSLKEQLSKFEDVVENAKEQVRVSTAAVNAERDSMIEEMQTQFEKLESARHEELRTLRSELQLLQDFKQRRAQLEKELDDARQELTDMQAAHRDAFAQLERKLFEEKQRVQREAADKVDQIKRHSEEEVVSRLDVSTKQIRQHNRKLTEDIRLHVQETEEVTRARDRLLEENRNLRRDMELNEQSVQEFAKHSYRQSKEIKELNQKVRNLERSLTQIVRDFEHERDRVVTRNRQEAEDLASENVGLRKVLQVKDKEHKRIKKLASDILNQRTEVEQFFLDALEQVKEEAKRQRLQQVQQQHDSVFMTQDSGARSGRLPDIKRDEEAHNNALQMARDSKVDIRDLGWEDKERVLRLLFARINQAQMPARVQMPPHSFEVVRGPQPVSREQTPDEMRRLQMSPEATHLPMPGLQSRIRPSME